jgi:hypothetical protein
MVPHATSPNFSSPITTGSTSSMQPYKAAQLDFNFSPKSITSDDSWGFLEVQNSSVQDTSIVEADLSMQAHMQRASLHAQHKRQGSIDHRRSSSLNSAPHSPRIFGSPSMESRVPEDTYGMQNLNSVVSEIEARDQAVHSKFAAAFFGSLARDAKRSPASLVSTSIQCNATSPPVSPTFATFKDIGKENQVTPPHSPLIKEIQLGQPQVQQNRSPRVIMSRPIEPARRQSSASFGSEISDSKRNSAHEAMIYGIGEASVHETSAANLTYVFNINNNNLPTRWPGSSLRE